jgi:uncharacterized glyoxalase superfamily protein PhnB
MAVCSCCGEERERLAGLLCRDDVLVCAVCVDWLRSQLRAVESTPILPVRDFAAAVAYYEASGFDVRRWEGGDFGFVAVDDHDVFNLDPAENFDRSANRSGCYLTVTDVEDWFTRLTATDAALTAVEDMPWGMREFTLTDPDGNHLRFGQPIPS